MLFGFHTTQHKPYHQANHSDELAHAQSIPNHLLRDLYSNQVGTVEIRFFHLAGLPLVSFQVFFADGYTTISTTPISLRGPPMVWRFLYN